MREHITEAQRLAWALGRHDLGVDHPTDAQIMADDGSGGGDDSPAEFAGWAEREFGGMTEQFVVMFDALTEIRRPAS